MNNEDLEHWLEGTIQQLFSSLGPEKFNVSEICSFKICILDMFLSWQLTIRNIIYSTIFISKIQIFYIIRILYLFSNSFFHFVEIIWTPKIFDNFSNFKTWIFQIVKLWNLNYFKNSIISQISQL